MLPMVRINFILLLIMTLTFFAAKFNCTVPGTLYDFTEECNITTTVTTLTKTTSTAITSVLISSTYTTFNASDNVSDTDQDPEVLYVLGGLGGGILILIFSTTIMCIYFGFQLAKRRRELLVVTAVPPHNMYTQQQSENGKINAVYVIAD